MEPGVVVNAATDDAGEAVAKRLVMLVDRGTVNAVTIEAEIVLNFSDIGAEASEDKLRWR